MREEEEAFKTGSPGREREYSDILISLVNPVETSGFIKFHDPFYFHLSCISFTSWNAGFPPTNMNIKLIGTSKLLLGEGGVWGCQAKICSNCSLLNTARKPSKPT